MPYEFQNEQGACQFNQCVGIDMDKNNTELIYIYFYEWHFAHDNICGCRPESIPYSFSYITIICQLLVRSVLHYITYVFIMLSLSCTCSMCF